MENSNIQLNQPKRKRVFLFIIIGLAVLLIGLFLYVGGYKMLKQVYDDWNTSRKAHEAIQKYNEFLDQYYKTLAEDTYGGKTPQETLNMFIDALEKGDIDLASKYFALDDNLSRKKWEDGLKKASEEGRIAKIIDIAKKVQPSDIQSGLNTEFEFVIVGNNGLVEYSIFMQFNEYSKIWKIERM